jgi:DNA primase
MRGRAIIPIHDDTGTDYVGMIGRTTKEYVSPKFLIYPKGFDKRHFFYNYHRAIPKAIETSCLYIVEGQGDVWKLYEAGVFNVVSIFGKTISKEQENKLIKLPITHLVILTDNDQAGREAKVKIKRQLSRFYKLTFPKMLNKDVGDMSIEQIQNQILSKLKGTY